MTALPANWKKKRIGEIAILNPRRPRELRELPDDYPVTFVDMAAVDSTTGTVRNPVVRPFAEIRKGFTYFRENDVIFAKITPCMQNGKSAIAQGLSNDLGMGSTEFHVLRPSDQEVLPEWIWYFVRQPSLLQEATRHFRGAVGQQRVPADYLAEHPIPVPPLDEQRRIVGRIREAMERVEELRQAARDRSDAINLLVPATLDDVFGQFAGTDLKLGDLLRVGPQNGLYLPKDRYSSNGVQMVHMGDMFRRFELLATMPRRVLADAKLLNKYGLQDGDVLVARRSIVFEGSGSMTHVGALIEPTLFESSIIRLRLDPDLLLPEFLVAFFFSRQGTERRLAITRRATISGVNQKGLVSLPVPVPPISAQREALARVSAIRRVSSQLHDTDTTEAIVRLPEAILRKAFAGEL